jgi:hypothetical protein
MLPQGNQTHDTADVGLQVVLVFDIIDQHRNMRRSFGSDVAIFHQVAAQGVNALRPLAYQQVPSPEHDPVRLLSFVLYRDKAHSWSLCRLTGRLGVGSVVLFASRKVWHTPVVSVGPDDLNLATCRSQVMRSATGLQCHQASGLG